MKKLNIITGAALALWLLASCASNSVLQKDIKRMDIRFKPLTRSDYTLVGNLEAEFTITGVASKKGKSLDKKFAADYKKGLINKSESTEILYFSPGAGEAITGSLYENEVFNNVYGSASLSQGKHGLLAGLRAKLTAAKPMVSDPGMDFGYYAMVQKYPDVDYFINVRFDRKSIISGGKLTETVIVKADGVKLKTDN